MAKFVPVAVAAFFISLHFGAVLYLNSSLLGNYFNQEVVSLLFIVGAVGNIVIFLNAARFIRTFGKRLLLTLALLVSITGVLGMVLSVTPTFIAVSFLLHASFLFVNYYCLDIYLEELSTDTRTGEVRGAYLTLVSLGIALGPLILSFLTNIENNLSNVYITSAVLLLVPLLFAVFSFKSDTPREHDPYHHSPRLPFKTWWHTPDVRRVTLSRVVLETFYTFMFIFTPVYLHSIIGFSWSELGIIFTVMLVPFILFEWPAGEVADRYWGEKEILNAGFVIMILALIFMPFIGKSFFVWMIILFISRVGASLIEVTTESYFFKQISADDTALISIFRLSRPVSIIFGAILGTLSLALISYEKIFFIIAIIVYIGFRQSLKIVDSL